MCIRDREENLSVTIIATGFSTSIIPGLLENGIVDVVKHRLNENDFENGEQKTQHLQGKSEYYKVGQKTIEFDISKEKKKEESDFEALYPNTTKERSGLHSKKAISDYSLMSDEDVDELENIPAYQRRQIRMNDPRYIKKVSGLSVSKDNKISDRNSYLHDQVD